jgi:hypothetical protein
MRGQIFSVLYRRHQRGVRQRHRKHIVESKSDLLGVHVLPQILPMSEVEIAKLESDLIKYIWRYASIE